MTTTDKDFVVKNGLVVQGAQGTIDNSVIITEAALDLSLGDYIALLEKGAADGVAELDASSNVKTVSAIVFEGATEDEYELTIGLSADPTVDRTITIPDASGNIVLDTAAQTLTNKNLTTPFITRVDTNAEGGQIDFARASDGSQAWYLDVFGETSNPSFRIIDINNASPVRMSFDGSGDISANGRFLLTASTTSSSSLRIPHGSVPSSPSNGDVWTTTSGMYVRINGSTVGPLGSGGGGGGGTTTNALTIGTGLSGGAYSTFDGSQAVTIAIDSTVATTSSSQTLTNKTLGSSTALSADLGAATYKITNLGTPTSSTDAATKQYVDDVAQGLHIHASCVAATTGNINLSTDLEASDVIDGVTLSAGNRVLVKNQSTTSENGIYTAVTSGAAVRATDFNEASEIQGGDFVFITGGTVNDNTGYVQVNTVNTVGTDPIVFVQFSGAGTYLSGNGLTLTGNIFSIDTTITTDLSTAQTLTNKTISGSANTISNISLTSSVTGTLPIANGGTNITTYTTGDILYASATNTLSKLGAGTEGHVLTISSGVPAWQASSGGSSDPNPQIFLLMGA